MGNEPLKKLVPRRHDSLRRTLLMAFLLLTLIPLIGVSALTIWQQYENSQAQIRNQLTSVATLKEAEVKSWFNSLSPDLELVVADPRVRSDITELIAGQRAEIAPTAQRGVLLDTLTVALTAGKKFDELFLMDTAGTVILSTNRIREGQTFDTQPFFQQGLNARYVQTPFYSLLYDKMVVFAAAPVRDEKGVAQGVLAGVASLDALNVIMRERAGLGQTGETYLVNSDSVMLTEPRYTSPGGFPAVHTQGAHAALAGLNGFGLYENYQYPATPVVGVYRWIPELRVALLAEQSQAEAFATTFQNIWTMLGITIVVAIATTSAAIVVARGIATPLEQLTSIATRLAGGDLMSTAQIERGDEIGLLAGAFNEMTAQLREMIGGLEGRVAARTAELKESEALYRSVLQASPDDITITDLEGRISMVSPSALKIWRCTREEELLGHDLAEFLVPEDAERAVAKIRHMLLQGKPLGSDAYRGLRPDGSVFDFEINGDLIRGADGQPTSMVFILRDITERKQVEEYIVRLNDLKQQLIGIRSLDEKLKLVTDGVIEIFGADFARVWLTQEADLCEKGCRYAAVAEGPDVCRNRTSCLHLVASSGRYTRIDGDHRRIPLGYYKIGHVAAGEDSQIVTNDVSADPRIHDPRWARSLGLVSFAGYRLVSADGKPIGVLALFRKRPIVSDEARLLESLANTTSQVILAGTAEQALARRAREMAALYETALEINSQPDVPLLLQAVVRRAVDLLGVRRGGLYLVRPDGQTLELVVSHNMLGHLVDTLLPLGEGLSGRVAQTGKLTMVDDYHHWEGRMAQYDDVTLRRVLAVPLKMGDRVIGVLNINDDVKTGPFNEEEIRLASLFADQAAIAVENARLYQAEREQHALAETLREIGVALASTLDVDTVLNRILEQVSRVVPNDAATIMLVEGDHTRIVRQSGYNHVGAQELVTAFTLRVANTPTFRLMVESGEPLVIPDTRADPRWTPLPETEWTRSYAGAPISARGEVIGFLNVDSATPGLYGPVHALRLRAFAAQAALAIENARLYTAVQQELAERRRIEAALRESEEHYRALVETSPDAITLTDLNGNLVMANRRAVELYRFASAEEMFGTNVFDLIAPEDRPRLIENIQKTLEAGSSRDIEYALLRKDGSRFPGEVSASVIGGAEGKPAMLVAVTRDMTERKQAEEALRESEENFRKLFDTNPFPLVITRAADGFLIQSNRAVADYLEVSSADLPSRHSLDYYARLADREALLNEIRTNGRVANQMVEFITGQGRSRFALVNMLPLDFAGESCLLVGLADITERKQMEEALLQAKAWAEERSQAAEAADRAKSIFLTNMSHELRTPLNAILGFSDLMARDSSLSAEQQENLTIINRSGEHLLSLINNVLDMAKIESGRMVLQARVFDLHHLLDNLADMFRLRAADKGLTLIVDRAPEVPRYIRADENKLRQVLINLLGNAVKFTGEGGVGLRVRSAGSEKPGFCQLRFEVQDTGPGITSHDLETVFEPFAQSAGGYKSSEGTGLGLPISRQFTRLMGGELAAESSGVPGQGALFKFDIPVELAVAADLPSLQKPERLRAIGLEPGQRAADGGAVSGGPYRLLVIEDREESRKLLIKLLTQFGFEVRAAANGLEGVNIWREWQPHLIWMDMRMPVMDGHEATQRIKATPQGQATVIIALTATAFEDQRELVLSEGCDDFVRKPFRESDIVDALIKHLGVRFIYESGRGTPPPSTPLQGALDLASLPADWIADLKQAAIEANADRVVALAEQIREQQPALAASLIDRINNFDWDTILGAISTLEPQEAKDE